MTEYRKQFLQNQYEKEVHKGIFWGMVLMLFIMMFFAFFPASSFGSVSTTTCDLDASSTYSCTTTADYSQEITDFFSVINVWGGWIIFFFVVVIVFLFVI